MRSKNLYFSLLVSLIWGGLFYIPMFLPGNKALAYIFITIIIFPPYLLMLQNESRKKLFTLKDIIFSVTISTLFIALVILNVFIENMYQSFYPLRYLASSMLLIYWGYSLWKIWFNQDLQSSLPVTTSDGMFKELSSGVIHYKPKGIWSKKVYILNTKNDKQKIRSIYYSYNIVFILSIALSVWKESWLLFFSLNIGFFALQSLLTKNITKNLEQIYIRNSFNDVIKSQAREMNYFFLLTTLPIFSFFAWIYFKKAIFLKEDILHDVFGAIILGFISLLIALILYCKIQITIKKSTNNT